MDRIQLLDLFLVAFLLRVQRIKTGHHLLLLHIANAVHQLVTRHLLELVDRRDLVLLLQNHVESLHLFLQCLAGLFEIILELLLEMLLAPQIFHQPLDLQIVGRRLGSTKIDGFLFGLLLSLSRLILDHSPVQKVNKRRGRLKLQVPEIPAEDTLRLDNTRIQFGVSVPYRGTH